jgi:membrane-bound metal-dependent hydrolase YbcI (DUF457 family)
MPITPFHFGPGLLMKGLLPRTTSFAAFCAAQVVIDVESLVHLVRGDWPIHRKMHTLLLAGPIGVCVGLALWAAARPFANRVAGLSRIGRAEVDLRGAVVGGAIGGFSHPLLDGIMHGDILPFWPASDGNPLYELLALGPLHLACVAAGAIGGALVLYRLRSDQLRGV